MKNISISNKVKRFAKKAILSAFVITLALNNAAIATYADSSAVAKATASYNSALSACNTAKAKMDSAKTQYNNASKAWSKGSVGFFEYCSKKGDASAKEALLLFDGILTGPDAKYLSKSDLTYTNLGAEKDATNLDMMKLALDTMKIGIKLRKTGWAELYSNGVEYREWALSHYWTAFMQIQTNKFSKNSKNVLAEHRGNYHSGSDTPYTYWYTYEKANYDDKKAGGSGNLYIGGETGHYRKLMSYYAYNTGMAVAQSWSYIWMQAHETKSGGSTMSYSKYYSTFMTYYNQVNPKQTKAALEKATTVYNNAKKALDAAKKELDAAKKATASSSTLNSSSTTKATTTKTTTSKSKDYTGPGAGTYTIKSAKNNAFVLDVAGGSATAGGNLQIYKSNNTDAQKWILTKSGNYYKIQNANSGEYLAPASNSKTNKVNVAQYNKSNSDLQLWLIGKNNDGSYYFENKATGKVLDIAGGSMQNKSNVQQYSYNGTKAQGWYFAKTKASSANYSGTYSIRSSKNTGYVLDVAGGSTANKANIQLYKSNGTAAQKWKITKVRGNYYKIVSVKSGKALDVSGGKAYNYNNVQQYGYNGTPAQLWKLTKNADGTFTFTSALSNSYALDLAGGRVENKRNIDIYKSNRSQAQKWVLQKAG